MKKAFTLIELLVVIAIIAILAAILFPVFAQAKAAAKATAGLSNVKQLVLGHLLYMNDFDDNRALRVEQDKINCDSSGNNCQVPDEHEWKELIVPYIKSTGLFQDPQNSLRTVPDVHSDPGGRTAWGWSPATLPANTTFSVSYTIVTLQLPGQPTHFTDGNAFVATSLPSPATTGLVMESHTFDADDGPYEGWAQYQASDFYAPGLTVPSQFVGKWNIAGDAYGDKASNVGYFDGHAKRLAYSQRDCTATNEGATGTTTDFYDIAGQDLVSASWEATSCQTLPAAFK